MAARDELLAIAKLQARSAGQAVLYASNLQIEIRKDAFLFAPLKMAGEERLWAAAFGIRSEQPTIVCAGDPRNITDEVTSVIHPAAVALDSYFQECEDEGVAPQVWVASPAAASLLDAQSDRRRSDDPLVQVFARHAWFLVDRYHHEGQQVLIPATGTLTQHFATGQSATEDQHLGALLAWIAPPKGETAETAAHREEETPAGIATDVDADHALEPALEALGEARKAQVDEEDPRIIVEKTTIMAALRPQAERVIGLIETAIRALERQALPPLPGLAELLEADRRAFEFYRRRAFIPSRFSPKEDAQHLASRESAAGAAHQAQLRGDSNAQAAAVHEGEILVGRIHSLVHGSRVNSFDGFDLLTDQAVSKLRLGDVLCIGADPRIACQLASIGTPPANGERTYSFLVKSGKTFVGRFKGTVVRLLPQAFTGIDRSLTQISDAHNAGPWVLKTDVPIPPSDGRKVPADPLAELEKLR